MVELARRPEWPDLRYAAWNDTCATLQLWMQIVGKVRLVRTPWTNHSWHVPFYLTARGLTTSSIPYEDRAFDAEFDFIDHALVLRSTDGGVRRVALKPRTVADFHLDVMRALDALHLTLRIDGMPNEVADPIAFDLDTVHAAYDAASAQRFWRILVQVHRVLTRFRTGFIGKCSPVHFFWGSFDLAVTRFSGRPAPRHPGGVPHLPDAVVREAYSHEVSSAGFWPGGGGADDAAFYSYAYPEPRGFRTAAVGPQEAFYSEALGEFLLPYAAVRTASDPDAMLFEFLQTTYAAAADAGHWDRPVLECEPGRAGIPRPTR